MASPTIAVGQENIGRNDTLVAIVGINDCNPRSILTLLEGGMQACITCRESTAKRFIIVIRIIARRVEFWREYNAIEARIAIIIGYILGIATCPRAFHSIGDSTAILAIMKARGFLGCSIEAQTTNVKLCFGSSPTLFLVALKSIRESTAILVPINIIIVTFGVFGIYLDWIVAAEIAEVVTTQSLVALHSIG